jgi:hypothetical protein
MSKLFSDFEFIAIVESAFGRPFCSPPVAKTDSAESLAAPADSGQAGGTLSPLQLFAFVGQLRNPSGFCVRVCDAEIMPRRHAEVRRA